MNEEERIDVLVADILASPSPFVMAATVIGAAATVMIDRKGASLSARFLRELANEIDPPVPVPDHSLTDL